ncbi:MAG TPA: hypothetical protein VKQ30_19590 [Ktedonobacterales bacterium]|nr:hypothetical protein [Ktedonobacterales bacterium]
MSLRRDNEFHSFVVRPDTTIAPPTPGGAGTTASAGWTQLAIAVARWARAQRTFWWWRVLILGSALLALAWLAIVPDTLSALVPVYTLAFAALLPAVAVVAWWEREGNLTTLNRDLPLALLCGLAAGVVSAFALYSGWLKLNVVTWQGALALAAGEELLKTLAVVYFLWSPRASGVRDGLRIGLAAALGFTLTQMALASYLVYRATVSAVPHAEALLFRSGIAALDHMLAFQLALQLLGEAVWTVTICAAIWRERGGRRFHLSPGLVVILLAVLVLHGAFNYTYANGWLQLRLGGVFLPLMNLLLAGIGFTLLRFFLAEEREQEALGALPPAALLPAFGAYLSERRRRMQRWYAGVVAESSGVTPARASNTGQGSPRPPNPPEPPASREPPNTEWLV